jgi:hypothetical protein
LQNVAKEELARDLSETEIARVEEKIGDYIDWRCVIASAIEDCVQS